MSLAHVLEHHRVIVTVGSGGVGKTTTAAALAMHAAMQGRRTVCLTIDPARRLANSLGLDAMTTDEQDVSKEIFASFGLEPKGSLSAMMLDTKRTFDDLVARNASSDEARDRILHNRIYQYVSKSLAGTQEYMAMEKLYAVRKDPKWDTIVLDTPPTSNALDFLDAPERLVDAIDSQAMRWFIQAFEGAGRLSFGLLGKGAQLVAKALAKFTGGEFLEQVAEFVTGLNDLFGGFKERAAEVSAALRSPDVAFIVVTSPDPMAIHEAVVFSDRLEGAGMRRDGVVINAVRTLIAEPSATDAEVEAAARAALPPEIDAKDAVERMWRALDHERTQAIAHRIEADRLRMRIGEGTTFVEVPALETDVHDLGGLAQIARYLMTDADLQHREAARALAAEREPNAATGAAAGAGRGPQEGA
ncbi:MAG: ArsA family ATPase [Myxococcales bacterium]|nr:ArsA family ATPase [Myxococcales bacterium]